ncbi:hypothetical protein DZ860_01370 [Vibrio sinensis]|uniref:Uncharacterized protein n=1 Tax=Vibrio sinensis TaxID=2302434 RepID=A0A3A6QR08_9VIBR|nr:hypothetical protein [Vibrio sinensis]RJX75360.1 hypothetical protein DZ860_01370 [Vibrio sinensis]
MERKLGQVMTNSRMVTFLAFLAAVFGWFLQMRVLLFVSVFTLCVGAVLYVHSKWHKQPA